MIVTRAHTPSKIHPLFPVKSSNDRHPFFDLDAVGPPKFPKHGVFPVKSSMNANHARTKRQDIAEFSRVIQMNAG